MICPVSNENPTEQQIGDALFRSVYRVDLERGLRLGSDHRKHFKAIWGRQSCTWSGDFRFWIWRHELKTCDLYVLSAREKGTSYEVVMKDNLMSVMTELLEFFEALKTNLRQQGCALN